MRFLRDPYNLTYAFTSNILGVVKTLIMFILNHIHISIERKIEIILFDLNKNLL